MHRTACIPQHSKPQMPVWRGFSASAGDFFVTCTGIDAGAMAGTGAMPDFDAH
jgi:hypothetical protein